MHEPSSGRSRSHTSPFTYHSSARATRGGQTVGTFAITTRSARPLEISFAMSSGLVSQLVPLRFEPSGIVISTS